MGWLVVTWGLTRALRMGAVQGAQSDVCAASLDDLFPPRYNVSAIREALDSAQLSVKATVPNPLVGFTLFLASDAAVNATNGTLPLVAASLLACVPGHFAEMLPGVQPCMCQRCHGMRPSAQRGQGGSLFK